MAGQMVWGARLGLSLGLDLSVTKYGEHVGFENTPHVLPHAGP